MYIGDQRRIISSILISFESKKINEGFNFHIPPAEAFPKFYIENPKRAGNKIWGSLQVEPKFSGAIIAKTLSIYMILNVANNLKYFVFLIHE